MTMSQRVQRERFCSDTGFTEQEAKELARLAGKAYEYNVGECNGDAHPKAQKLNDKNECTKLWGADLDAVTVKLRAIAEPKGFTVEYTGLRPCLKKGGNYVEIPR